MKGDATAVRQTPHALTRCLWGAVGLMMTIGVAAAILRGVFPGDLGARTDPVRQRVLRSLDRADPLASSRAAEIRRFDSRFAAHPVLTFLHILPGGTFILLAPLQFSSRVRSRHIRFHRWLGRGLVIAALISGLTALYFGLLIPFGGLGEGTAIAVFGGLFLAAVSRAFVAIRRHQAARHREWMIRAFAIALAISVIRLIAAVLDIALTPAGFRPDEIFVLSLWSGWIVTLGAAELWIRYTRPRPALVTMPARAQEIPPGV
jgi:uncharacterized membrane protein